MYENVYLVAKRLKRATPAQVAILTAKVGTLPPGYAEYVTTLGLGLYSTFIRIYMPLRIALEWRDVRSRWKEYFLWDEKTLTKKELLESLIVGDTLNGDELVYHPGHTDSIFILPRHHDSIFRVAGGLEQVIDWACSSGKLTAPISFRYFESELGRRRIELRAPHSFAQTQKAIIGKGIHSHVGAFDRKEEFLLLFFEPIGGSLAYYGETHTAVLEIDSGHVADAESIIDALRSLGLRTPEEEKAARAKAGANFPTRDSGADATAVLKAFMKAMRLWEERQAEGPHGDWEDFVKFSNEIADNFFVKNPQAFLSSTPTCYDAKTNKIVIDEERANKAVIHTERALRGGDVVRMDYKLKRSRDGWRIAKMTLESPWTIQQKF